MPAMKPIRRMTGQRAVDRRARYLSAHPLCVACKAKGRLTIATEVDHVLALMNGGADDLESNGQALCTSHHRVKTAQDKGFRIRPRIGADGYLIEDD